MVNILIVGMILTGVVFSGSILMMSPKGGLGMGIGGLSQSNEYGSKKSLEGKLKYVAVVSGVAFMLISLFLPYALRG